MKLIEKKIRISKEQNKVLKLKAKEYKISEAQIVRNLIDGLVAIKHITK